MYVWMGVRPEKEAPSVYYSTSFQPQRVMGGKRGGQPALVILHFQEYVTANLSSLAHFDTCTWMERRDEDARRGVDGSILQFSKERHPHSM